MPGGQVRQQEIERTPPGLVDHLFEGADRHGAAPQQGVGGFDEESDRHEPDVHRLGRDDAVSTLLRETASGTYPFYPEHLGLRGTVNIGVEDSDAEPHVPQRDGQVGRDGGLAYPPLPEATAITLAMPPVVVFWLGFGARCGAALLDDHQHFGVRKGLAQKLRPGS